MKLIIIGLMLIGLGLKGVHCDDIKCYDGIGDVGSDGVTEKDDGYKSCSIAVYEAAGQRVVAHLGVKTKMDEKCVEQEFSGAKGEICFCHDEDLCNSAPATVAAILPIIIMSLVAKFMV